MPQKPDVIVKVAWLLLRDRQVLFARKKGDTLFITVGGKPEIKNKKLETDHEALIREAEEEADVTLIASSIEFFCEVTAPIPGRNGQEVLIRAYLCQDFLGFPVPSGEIEELGWFSSAGAPKTTGAGRLILSQLVKKKLID